MTAVTAHAAPDGARTGLRRWLDANPSPGRELLAVSVAAWLAVVPHLLGAGGATTSSGQGAGAGAWMVGTVAAAVAFTVMAAAMTLPAARPAASYVARASFPARRGRSVTWFAAGAVAAWVPFAAVAAVWHESAGAVPPPVAAAGFVAVAGWTVSRRRLYRLRRCLRTQPVRAHGRAADRSSLAYGLAVGRRCTIICGPAMAVALLAGHPPLVVGWLATTAWAERSLDVGERLTRPIAAGWLAVAGLWLIAG